jgi:hypothetical protein
MADHIEQEHLEKAGPLLAALNQAETGLIQSVTLTVDNETGDVLMKVEAAMMPEILMVVEQPS